MTFEKAVESFEQAKKIWNTTEATDLLAQAKQSIANRKHRLAVIDFAISGDVNMRDAGVSVAGLLQADAMLASRFEIIERRQLQKMLEEIKLQMSDLVGDNEKAAEFGRIKGVPYILTGQVIKLGKLSVTAYILEVQSGRQIAQAKVSADDAHSLEAKLPDLSRILCMTPEELKEYEAQQPGQVFIEDLGGGVNLEMGWIPAGSFEMGSPDSEAGRYKQEGPVHTVSLDGFWMGKYEVTQEQYEAVMGTNPSKFKGAKNPVENVSWGDAMAFCKKLSLKTGKNFTLPSEAQWEYACRAGSKGRFCFGDSDSGLGDYAWYIVNSGPQTHPVGQKKPNKWGLYDMHGNVWEWCLDRFASRFYEKQTARERNPVNNNQGDYLVLRGGAWPSKPRNCRSAGRFWGVLPDNRDDKSGFRVVSFSP
ncbi:MAG: Serine/threonine-protein kinase pkn1 [candidate division BRC1 bacterium ADurb.Bin183]|nr:MAG: Serine/threonine-protein kinase pkn1 [candidate division BRC1 bacterium ADurb.Bin183]